MIAEIAHVPRGTVRDWVLSGRLRSVKPGRHRLVHAADLDAFLAVDLTRDRRVAKSATSKTAG